MLMGSQKTIQKARRHRIWLGGGVHQAGMQAAGAYYALTHNLESLKKDHELAKYFAKMLIAIPEISINYNEVETNMVQITLQKPMSDSGIFLDQCAKQDLLLFPWVPGVVRAVIHRHITRQDLEQAASIIDNIVRTRNQTAKIAG
jgi:threonine aldolase